MDMSPKPITHALLHLFEALAMAARCLAGMPRLCDDHRRCLAEFLIISGLVAVQVINAVYMVLLTPVLSLGIDPLFLVFSGSLTTAFLVLPFAIAFERKKWPKRLSLTLMAQFVLVSLGGVTTYQALILQGIKKTSPAIASAMPNLAPGIIFVIAACLRFEKVDIRCMYSRAKILGTLLCLTGAVTMSILQSPPTSPTMASQGSINQDWLIGCLYLLAAVMVLSCTTVLQAAMMIHFPAPLTLCVIYTLMGAILTALVQIIIEGKVDIGSPTISFSSIIAIVVLGAMVIGLCLAFQTWSVQRKGPVLVSMFSPIQTVCSAILSALFLGKVINPGSVVGMFLMFFGLYAVLWAKKKEEDQSGNSEDNTRQSVDDIERPLLS